MMVEPRKPGVSTSKGTALEEVVKTQGEG